MATVGLMRPAGTPTRHHSRHYLRSGVDPLLRPAAAAALLQPHVCRQRALHHSAACPGRLLSKLARLVGGLILTVSVVLACAVHWVLFCCSAHVLVCTHQLRRCHVSVCGAVAPPQSRCSAVALPRLWLVLCHDKKFGDGCGFGLRVLTLLGQVLSHVSDPSFALAGPHTACH